MNDIRDIRPPAEIPLYIWALIALIVLAGAVAAYFFFRKRKTVLALPEPVEVRLPWEIAFGKLEELRLQGYPQTGKFKEFYSCLSDIARHYLEDQFHVHAPEMTTEEFLFYAQTSGLPSTAKHLAPLLKDFLMACDLVKFAKHQPTVVDAQSNFDLVKKLIEETK